MDWDGPKDGLAMEQESRRPRYEKGLERWTTREPDVFTAAVDCLGHVCCWLLVV